MLGWRGQHAGVSCLRGGTGRHERKSTTKIVIGLRNRRQNHGNKKSAMRIALQLAYTSKSGCSSVLFCAPAAAPVGMVLLAHCADDM
eukprot:3652154-Rhodomonas_salina.1